MTAQRLRILVPVDFSEDSLCALDEAFTRALQTPAELHLMHVIEHGGEGLPRELVDATRELRRAVEVALARRFPDDQERARIGEPAYHIGVGRPAAEILSMAGHQGIDLIVMGTHGRTGLRRLLVGSVAEKVVRMAACPVLCVKLAGAGARPTAWERLLCPVDFSDASRRAMFRAVELAGRLGVELQLLHVYTIPVLTTPHGMVASGPELIEAARLAAEAQLASQRNDALERASPGQTILAACTPGLPADEIVRFARERPGGAIVMGTHGRTGLLHLVMGSVAERVVRTAPCPVLVIPPGA